MNLAALKERARRVKVELIALGLATRDPRTPWYAKAFTGIVVAYALSPITGMKSGITSTGESA